jgi:hypothetical protein
MTQHLVMQLTTVVCLCAAASPASAHHSHGMFYDPCTSVTAEGKIESIQWKNPHILIDLRTNEGAALRGEWTSLQGVMNSGIAGPAAEALKVGERIAIAGNPLRDAAAIRASFPAYKEPADKTKVIDVLQIRHGDNWSWANPADATPRACAQK